MLQTNLILTRKLMESIEVGPDITITVVKIGPNSGRLSIKAPRDLNVVRTEIKRPEQQG